MSDYYGFTWQMIEFHKDSSLFRCWRHFVHGQTVKQPVHFGIVYFGYPLLSDECICEKIPYVFFYIGILLFWSPGSDQTSYNKIIIRRSRFKRLESVLTKSRKKDRKS